MNKLFLTIRNNWNIHKLLTNNGIPAISIVERHAESWNLTLVVVNDFYFTPTIFNWFKINNKYRKVIILNAGRSLATGFSKAAAAEELPLIAWKHISNHTILLDPHLQVQRRV